MSICRFTSHKHLILGTCCALAFVVLAVLFVPSVLAAISKSQGAASAHAGHQIRQPFADTNGLVAWYPLDGNANDVSGNNYNGTLNGFTFNGSTNGWVAGKFGQGLLFNGSTNSVTASPSVINFGTGDFTISVWVKTSSTNAAAILDNDFAGNTHVLELNMTSSGYAHYQSENTGSAEQSTIAINNGRWHQIVVTRQSGTDYLYVDNVLQGTGVDTATLPAVQNFNIGYGINAGYFAGSVDDVRVYNRAISPLEVTNLYSGSQPENCDQTCVGWWKLDGSGTTTPQPATLSGFTYNGTTNGWVTGKFGNGLLFAGGQYAETSTFSGLSNVSAPQTLSAWVNTTSTNAAIIFGTDNSSTAGSLIELTSGGVPFVGNWGGSTIVTGTSAVNDGAWHLLVYTWNGTTNYLYVDGTQVGTSTTTPQSSTSFNVWFGAWGTGGGNGNFTGTLDDTRIYNRALSAAEITNLYTAKNPDAASIDNTLVGYWPLNESGTTSTTQDYSWGHAAYDASGNGNDAPLTTYAFNGTTDGWTSGIFGNALLFNGSGDYFNLPSTVTLSDTESYSITLWFNPSSSTEAGTLITDGCSCGSDKVFLYTAGTSYHIVNWGGVDSGVTAIANTWNYVAFTYTSSGTATGTQSISVNGSTPVSLTGTVPTWASNSGYFRVGLTTSPSHPFSGAIDDIRIYNRALAPYEIYEQYSAGIGGT